MADTLQIESAYQLALTGALAVRHPDPGVIRVKGRDRLDLLNRMSTNKVDHLEPGQHAPTVLTNPVGQTVDRLEVLVLEDRLMLVTSPGRAQRVFDWLSGYIFFQDQVTLEVVGDVWGLWGCYGPGSAQDVAWLIGESQIRLDQLAVFEGGLAWQAPKILAPGQILLLNPEADRQAAAHWPGHGWGSAAAEAFEILRIERGAAAIGREILDDTIPLEAGLWDAVSFSKGCYIGQEIIARLESRGKLAKQLVGVRLEAETPADADLTQAGHRVGRMSSVAYSPSLGWIGLALAQPAALDTDDGQVLVSGNAAARLVRLPLASPAPDPA
jgi:folate-binding protein YgfZ